MNVCKKKYMIMLLASGGIGVIKAPESPFNAGPPMAESPFGATTNTFRPESNSVAPQQVNSEFVATQREPFQEPMPQNRPQSEPFESRSYEPTNSFEPRPSEQTSEHVFGSSFSENLQEREEPSRSVMSGSYDHHDSHEHQDNQFHPEHVMSEPSKVAPSSVNKPKQIDNKQEDAEEKMVGATVDTFDTDGSGNWVLKRVWWEKIESVYEEIKKVFNDILNARMEFVSQRNSLDREMDVFYGQVGLEEGQLESIISQGLAFLQKSKTDQNFLTAKDEEFSKLIQGKDRDFEQIKLDMEALKELDQKIDEALDTLFQQIDIANKYEQKAQFYAEIAGYDSTNRFAFQDNRYIPLHIVLFFETATLTALTLCCAITSSAFGLAASGAFIAPVVLLSVLLLSSIGEYISGLYLRNTISKEVPRFLESPALRNCENDEKILRFSRIYDKYKSVSI